MRTPGVVDAILLLLHFDLGRPADADDCDLLLLGLNLRGGLRFTATETVCILGLTYLFAGIGLPQIGQDRTRSCRSNQLSF
jgi:hypothetical protein